MLGLYNLLAPMTAPVVILNYQTIEAAIGRPLPPSAWSATSWTWTNASNNRSWAWLNAGYRVWRADPVNGIVEFRKI